MSDIEKIIDRMDPEEALAEMSTVIRKLFLAAGIETRNRFVAGIVGQSGNDKVGSLVHL